MPRVRFCRDTRLARYSCQVFCERKIFASEFLEGNFPLEKQDVRDERVRRTVYTCLYIGYLSKVRSFDAIVSFQDTTDTRARQK